MPGEQDIWVSLPEPPGTQPSAPQCNPQWPPETYLPLTPALTLCQATHHSLFSQTSGVAQGLAPSPDLRRLGAPPAYLRDLNLAWPLA